MSRNEDELKQYFKLDRILPSQESVFIADSKNRAMEFARSLNIPTPRFIIPRNEHELDKFSQKITYPVVVKGEKGAGAWKVRYAYDYQQLRKHYLDIIRLEKAYNGKPSIQEYIKGEASLVHVLCFKGEMIRICSHIKKLQYPPKGGITAVGETFYDPLLIKYVSKMCRALKWTGLSKFDFIKDKTTEEYKFIELDPRVSASIIIPQIAGTEMIESFCHIIEGKQVESDPSYSTGVRYRFILPRELQYLARNPDYIFRFMSLFLKRNTYSDFCLSDIKPTMRNIRTTLYRLKEEFLFHRGKYNLISSHHY
jgi:biotin carboxylase